MPFQAPFSSLETGFLIMIIINFCIPFITGSQYILHPLRSDHPVKWYEMHGNFNIYLLLILPTMGFCCLCCWILFIVLLGFCCLCCWDSVVCAVNSSVPKVYCKTKPICKEQ